MATYLPWDETREERDGTPCRGFGPSALVNLHAPQRAAPRHLIEDAPRDLPQLAKRDQVLHLTRRYPKPLSSLGYGEKSHDRQFRLANLSVHRRL